MCERTTMWRIEALESLAVIHELVRKADIWCDSYVEQYLRILKNGSKFQSFFPPLTIILEEYVFTNHAMFADLCKATPKHSVLSYQPTGVLMQYSQATHAWFFQKSKDKWHVSHVSIFHRTFQHWLVVWNISIHFLFFHVLGTSNHPSWRTHIF